MYLLVGIYMIKRNSYAFISQLNGAVCQFLDNGHAHFGQSGIQIGLVTQDAVGRRSATTAAFRGTGSFEGGGRKDDAGT